MKDLTGLTGFDWILLFLYAGGLVLALGSWWRGLPGTRFAGALVVPFLGAIAGLTFLVVAYHSETGRAISRLPDRMLAIAVAAAVLFGAVAVSHFQLTSVSAVVRRAASKLSRRHAADIALVVAVVLPAAAALVGVTLARDRLPSSYDEGRLFPEDRVSVLGNYHLSGQPMDVVFHTETRGYMSFAEGEIAAFELSTGSGGGFRSRTVARGLRYPRGLAIIGDVLAVAELGPLPCRDPVPLCKGDNIPGVSVMEGERQILRSSRGRILAFDVQDDGGLAGRRVIADRLPVVDTDHGVNGIVAGPNGLFYVSIGNVDKLHSTPEVASDPRTPNGHLLGTVVELAPDGSRLDVFARGLRNVYDLTFDDSGRLYGADNDGPTISGSRLEEVLQIRRGAHYGFPYDGSFAPYSRRTDPPLWTTGTVGSAGIEWIQDEGRDPQLLVGSCGNLQSLALSEGSGGVFVDRGDEEVDLLEVPGCVTSVEQGPGGTFVLTVFTYFPDSARLYVIRLEP